MSVQTKFGVWKLDSSVTFGLEAGNQASVPSANMPKVLVLSFFIIVYWDLLAALAGVSRPSLGVRK